MYFHMIKGGIYSPFYNFIISGPSTEEMKRRPARNKGNQPINMSIGNPENSFLFGVK
jgi:hypothetical protein